MAQLKRETYLTLTSGDLRDILTEEVCKGYGILGELTVSIVKQNSDGDFDLVLTPKPEEVE